MKSLALAYTNQGKNADAEALYKRALAIPVQQMGLRFAAGPNALAALVRQRQDLSAFWHDRDKALLVALAKPQGQQSPTALDVTIQAQILRLLASLRRELDMAVILTTHDPGIVARVATHAAVMYAREIVETGSAREVFAQPMHPYYAGAVALHAGARTDQAPRAARLHPRPGAEPDRRPQGCAFRNRCPYAFEDCARAHVALGELSPGRACRCLLPPGTMRGERGGGGRVIRGGPTSNKPR